MELGGTPDALAALSDLLQLHSEARISAIYPDGNPAQVPTELVLGPQQIPVDSPGLAGYVSEDRPAVLIAFDRALTAGFAETLARPVNDSTPIALHLLNVVATYGVVIAVAVPQQDQLSIVKLRDVPVVAPRVARMKKSQLAAIEHVDEATTTILGWTPSEIVGRRSLEFIHPDDQGLAIENWLHLMTNPETPTRMRVRHRARSGGWLWFEVSQTNLLAEDEQCVMAELVDVSQEMAAQQALEAREQLLHQLTQALPLGVFQIDAAGTVVYTNERLFEVIGLEGAQNVMELLATVDVDYRHVIDEALEAVLQGALERTVAVHLQIRNEDNPRICWISLRPLTGPGGEVSGAVGCVADVTESTQLRRQLEYRATHDGLTRCLNRTATMAKLDSVLESTRQPAGGTCVVFVDLDHFKQVNDRLGHAAGDQLLTNTADLLKRIAGARSSVGRMGGDEFLVIVPDVLTADAAAQIAATISIELHSTMSFGNHDVFTSASVGHAWTESSSTTGDQLVARADDAMYESKRSRPAQTSFTERSAPPDRLIPHQHELPLSRSGA